MTWTPATQAEFEEVVDDLAADDPLNALREIPHLLTPYRLDACAMQEPAAALIYAHDLLTLERRAWCMKSAQWADLHRFIPDRVEQERRALLDLSRGGRPCPRGSAACAPTPRAARRTGSRSTFASTGGCFSAPPIAR